MSATITVHVTPPSSLLSILNPVVAGGFPDGVFHVTSNSVSDTTATLTLSGGSGSVGANACTLGLPLPNVFVAKTLYKWSVFGVNPV